MNHWHTETKVTDHPPTPTTTGGTTITARCYCGFGVTAVILPEQPEAWCRPRVEQSLRNHCDRKVVISE